MATFASLRTLHTLIGGALDDIERIFASHRGDKGPNPVPLDFPSLDEPYDLLSPAEALLSNPTVTRASKLIVSATGQLAATIQQPFLAISDVTLGHCLSSCMRFLEASHLVEAMREAGPAGLHVRDLAARVDCDPGKLAHILRLLATHHVGKEVSPNVFANNRLSSIVDSGKDFGAIMANPTAKYDSTNGIAAVVRLGTDENHKSSAYLTETFLFNEKTKHSFLPSDAPFNLAFRTNKPFFSWLEEEGNEPRLKRFGQGMVATSRMEEGGSEADGFDWAGLADGSLVVDVGGGIGSLSMTLTKAFPHLRFCIQDRLKTVENGIAVWKEQHPEKLESGRVVFQTHDFFAEQPVKDAAVFLLRFITHDWPDDLVARILSQLRRAATPQTKLVIVETILPFACEDRTGGVGTVRTLAPPGSGLLPNLGKANAILFMLDLNMHLMFNGKERTLQEMREIALSVGWEITEVIRKPEGSLIGSIVAVPTLIPASANLVSPFAGGMEPSRSNSSVRKMTERLRKSFSKRLSRMKQSGELGEGGEGRPVVVGL